MGTIRDAFFAAFRDYNTDGVPSSGEHDVVKSEVRTIGALIESAIGATLGAVTVAKDTRVNLNADLAHPAGTVALVYADATDANNDLYTKTGASGAGAWTNTGALHSIVNALTGAYVADLTAATQALARNVAGPLTPDATGTQFQNPAAYFWPTSKKTYDQYLTKLEVGVQPAGTFRLVVARHEGDNTLSLVSSTVVSFTATGAQVLDNLNIYVPAGCVIGLQCNSGGSYYTAAVMPGGATLWYIADGNVGSHTAYVSSTTNGPHWRATLDGEVAAKARIAYTMALSLAAQIGSLSVQGWPNPIVTTGDDTPGGYTIISQVPAPADGILSEVRVGVDKAASADILIVSVNPGTLVATIIGSPITVALAPGVNVITLQTPIAAGQYVAIRGGGYKFQAFTNPTGLAVWVKAGSLSSGDVVTSSTQHRYEVQWTVKTGLFAVGNGGAGAIGTGLDVLATADSTGASDATAAFNTARASHPFPYVRPGNFKVTAMPSSGDGFWGPGLVDENGERSFIPLRPDNGNLFDRFRASLSDHIEAGDVLTLIADSIGHFAYAPSGPEHWFNRVTRFANRGIAKDEPVMTALRPSATYTPAFYGVTTSGTVSTGTNGPLAESLVLATGASLSFVGAYEQVDLFYTQQAGAGSLAFSFNGGAAYKTVNAAGATVLDSYTGPSATGQAGSGTYTITAVGGPVELTGLVRLGVKAAGSRKRLRTNRSAHGSYTFGNFNSAAVVASLVKQATYAGGKLVPLIALGINDSFGGPGGLVANATGMLDKLVAAGVTSEMYGVIPSRPTAVWDPTYGANNYDASISQLRKLYRARGVTIIGGDILDWLGEGLYQDGLHPNGPGQHKYGQLVVEGIAYR